MTSRLVSQRELSEPLTPYEDARARILANFGPLRSALVPVADALDLVAADSIVAGRDVPAFASSAMDGFAVVSSDVASATIEQPVSLRVVGEVAAGSAGSALLQHGTAVKIMTGAPIPRNADAVVPWEDAAWTDVEVSISAPAVDGQHVRSSGEDILTGAMLIPAGSTLRPIELAVISSLGLSHVRVHPRPRVAILATGDEVVAPGADAGPGKTYDSNTTLLRTMCTAVGASVVEAALASDQPEEISRWMTRAAGIADLIITTAGVSVGEHDWVREVLQSEGELDLWRVAMKPGKPIASARFAGVPVIALPGNPGSAFIGAHAFVLPAVRKMLGKPADPASAVLALARDVRGNPTRLVFCPVNVEGGAAIPVTDRSSGSLSHYLTIDGLALIPPGGARAGAQVRVESI